MGVASPTRAIAPRPNPIKNRPEPPNLSRRRQQCGSRPSAERHPRKCWRAARSGARMRKPFSNRRGDVAMYARSSLTAVITAALLTAVAGPSSTSAQSPSKVDAGLLSTKELLRLMDTDKNGKVSRQEFMNFMSAEFDRLDVNKDGELDVKELVQMQVHFRRPGLQERK